MSLLRLIERSRSFMNTTISIKVVQKNQNTVEILDSIEAAFGEFDRIVDKFTRFNENSELSNLNRQPGKWIVVSEEFFSLVSLMITISKQTNYAFDPTIIDFLETYGYDKNYDFSKLDSPELQKFVEDIAKKRKSIEKISLDKKNYKIKLSSNQRIDLGGIGKGYAVDCAAKKLLEISQNFLIDAGGDVYAAGRNQSEQPWIISLHDKSGEVGMIKLEDMALASSGNWARKVKQFHHIINPTTGKPVNKNFNTVFVKAESATIADAWATALFVNPDLDHDFEVLFS